MLYHEWLLTMLRKEREMKKLDTAMDTVDPRQGDLFLHGMTKCAHCGDLLHLEEASVHVYYDDQGQQEEHFCPDKLQPEQSCQQRWYINRLNTLGL